MAPYPRVDVGALSRLCSWVLLSGRQEEGAVLLVCSCQSQLYILLKQQKKSQKNQKTKKSTKNEYTIRFSFSLCWRFGKVCALLIRFYDFVFLTLFQLFFLHSTVTLLRVCFLKSLTKSGLWHLSGFVVML
jgi:hypothetical protein